MSPQKGMLFDLIASVNNQNIWFETKKGVKKTYKKVLNKW